MFYAAFEVVRSLCQALEQSDACRPSCIVELTLTGPVCLRSVATAAPAPSSALPAGERSTLAGFHKQMLPSVRPPASTPACSAARSESHIKVLTPLACTIRTRRHSDGTGCACVHNARTETVTGGLTGRPCGSRPMAPHARRSKRSGAVTEPPAAGISASSDAKSSRKICVRTALHPLQIPCNAT